MRFLTRLFRRRFPRRSVLILAVVFLIVVVYQLGSKSIDEDEEWYKHPDVFFSEVSCAHDEFTLKQFEELNQKLISTFEKLDMRYFLCYGSLWGALKFNQVLPWDRNIDMCIVYHELVTVGDKQLHQTLRLNGLDFYYNARRGKYVITYKTVSADVTVFEKVGTHLERVGWEKRVFPHLYVNYQNFPYQLIDRKMPRLTFHNRQVSVPHQEFEIQKYFYPDNWWKEVKPKGCL